MADLRGQKHDDTFEGLLQVPGTISATLVAVQDGAGTDSALQVSTGTININGTFQVNGSELSGDVGGPASSTDNALTRFDGTNGKTLQNSGWTLNDSDAMAGVSLTLTTPLAVPQGGIGVATLTDGGPLLGGGTGVVKAMAVLADSEMIVGDGTTDPVAESGATLRTSIGVAIGSDVQAFDTVLDDLAALAVVADNEFVVGIGAGTYAHESGATARTSMGVGTGDSPRFTGIEVGNASDTTITRVSAGLIAVEGSNIIRASDAASVTASGIIEVATAAETNTGTDAARALSPDGLAGSNYGTAIIQVLIFDDGTNCATGDGAGDVFLRIPVELNGFDLVDVEASVQTTGITGTMDIQIANVTDTTDMLSTKITIDSAEKDSSTAATPPVINTVNDDVATADQLRIDVDAVHTTAAKGLLVELHFRLP